MAAKWVQGLRVLLQRLLLVCRLWALVGDGTSLLALHAPPGHGLSAAAAALHIQVLGQGGMSPVKPFIVWSAQESQPSRWRSWFRWAQWWCTCMHRYR